MAVVYWAELQAGGRPLGRLAWRGAYAGGTHYQAGDIVSSGGNAYVAVAERPPGGPAPGSVPWELLSDAFGGVPLPAPPVLHLLPGTPQLRGPYVVDHTDIPHVGDKKTLWTPAVGDVLLRLFVDWQASTPWNHGSLFVGQNVDGTGGGNGQHVIATGSGDMSTLDTVSGTSGNGMSDGTGNAHYSSAYVFGTTDPVQIQLAQTGGTDPTAGHVELYALVARAVPPT